MLENDMLDILSALAGADIHAVTRGDNDPAANDCDFA